MDKIFSTYVETTTLQMKITCFELNDLIEAQNILNAYVEILTKIVYSGVNENETL